MALKFRWETEFQETKLGFKIPSEWKEKKVKDIGEVGGGTTPSTKKVAYWNGIVPWITPNDLANHEYRYITEGERNITDKAVKECSLKIFPRGTILLSTRAPIGYAAIAENQLTTNQGFRNIIPRENVNSEYIYYYLTAITDYLRDIAGGSTFQELTGTTLKQVMCPYPSIAEQARIAAILSWFDDLIENKKKQNEILEKTAMAIFKSWFIDFEPFKDEEFVDSELGKIPKGWEIKNLKSVVKIIMGQSPSSKYYNTEGDGLLFIQGMGQFGRYTPSTDVYCSKIMKLAKPKDILITVRAPVGELNIADNDYIIGRGVASLRSRDWIFLYLYLMANNELVKSYERGTTYDAITIEELESFPLLFPPNSMLKKFHSLVEPLFKKILSNQKQIMILRKIRDTLLPLLVFGKLRVEEI